MHLTTPTTREHSGVAAHADGSTSMSLSMPIGGTLGKVVTSVSDG